jgi:hypothetical protein
MDKADNVRVVRTLDARGIFLIKGAVEAVAYVLNVSRYTIYNYLDGGRRLGILTIYWGAIVGKTGEEVITADTYT